MVISMTNRLLALVVALALSSGVVAHAAQAPQKSLGLPTATDLPTALQTAASHITESATSAIDPAAAIRDAYQRDHVALEALRQQASALKGSAHPAFNQYIDGQEASLTELLHTSLATLRPSAGSTIANMDALVAAAQAKLAQELQSDAKSTSASDNGHHNGAANGQRNAQPKSNGRGND